MKGAIARLILLLFMECFLQHAQALSAGTTFLVAFPPSKLGTTSGRCQIIIDSKYTYATVQVSNSQTSESFTVSPYLPLQYSVNCNRRTIGGFENKAYVITSDYDVTVKLLNEGDDTFADVALAQPVDANTTEYYLLTEAVALVGECTAENVFGFAVMMALEEFTLVNVLNPDGTTFDQFYLEPYQTYTVTRPFDLRAVTYSGFKVIASAGKPIAVIGGNACYSNGNAAVASPTFAFMPPVTRLGLNHIIPPLPSAYGVQQQYLLRVVASQNLILKLTGINDLVMTPGQTYVREYNSNLAIVANCTLPCLIAITTENAGPSFTSIISPTSQYNKDVYFTQPNLGSSTVLDYMVILTALTAVAPTDEYLINGEVLAGDWTCSTGVDGAYCTTQVSLELKPNNIRNIGSDPSDVFSALMYVGLRDISGDYVGRGFGNQVATSSVLVDPLPPPEAVFPNPPIYDIYTLGDFISENNSAIDQNCQFQYGESMRDRALNMIPAVNQEIGNQLCQQLTTDDVRITAVSSVFGTVEDDTQGSVNLKWRLFVASSASIGGVEDCAAEILDYLSAYDNWGRPLLPSIDGCPTLTFVGDNFEQLIDGWQCELEAARSRRNSRVSKTVTSTLKSRVQLNGYLQTISGEIMSGSCSNFLEDSFLNSAIAQVQEVNNLINDGRLCQGNTEVLIDDVNIAWDTYGDKGMNSIILDLDPPGGLTFTSIQECISDVSEFMRDQDNWDGDVIPDVPGCPDVELTDFSFEERDRSYFCP